MITRFDRSDRIWTCDPLSPRQVRYRTALHPDTAISYHKWGAKKRGLTPDCTPPILNGQDICYTFRSNRIWSIFFSRRLFLQVFLLTCQRWRAINGSIPRQGKRNFLFFLLARKKQWPNALCAEILLYDLFGTLEIQHILRHCSFVYVFYLHNKVSSLCEDVTRVKNLSILSPASFRFPVLP